MMRCSVLMWGMCLSTFCSAATTAPATSPASAPSSASPIEVARQFARVFAEPTTERLRACVAGRTPEEEKAAELWAASMAAQFRLQETVRAKLGNAGYAEFFGRAPRPRPSAEDVAKQLDQLFADAKVEIGQLEARVTVRSGASTEQLWLTRTPDGWKMWIGAVLQARSPALVEQYISSNAAYAKVRNQVADDIEAGKVSNAREAKVLLNGLEDDEAAQSDPASTQVATPEQGKAELRDKLKKMQEIEAEQARLEQEASTQPVR